MKFLKRPMTFFLALLMLLPLIFSGQPAQAIAGGGVAKSTYRAYGADLSSWNVDGSALNYSLIDFARMKADGCQFVILRIGYEGSVSRNNTMDTAFLEYYKRARAAGMPMGVYFYSLTTTYNGAVEDANWVADQIEKNGMYFEYPIFYDVEDGAQTALGASAMEQLCLGWCETLEKRGYFPGVYGGGTQVINKLSANFKSRYDLWYPIVLNSGHGNQYDPNAYDRSDYCNMWQYAWYDCNYDGVGLDMLDVNVCYKNYPAIMSQYGYNNCAVMNTAPTVASVSLSKDSFKVNEELGFSVSANGTSTKLNIKRVDGQWENSYDVGSYFTLAFGWKGKYEAHIVTTNAKGSKTSSKIYFYIGEPTYSKITAAKSQYTVGETAKFTLDSDGSTNTVWIYYPDGTSKYFQNLSTSFSTTFSQTGKHEALVEAWNGVGSLCSEKISFTVVQGGTTSDKPTSASISANKSTVKVNESITLNFSGNGVYNTLWVYYPDGTSKYYQNAGTSKTLTFTKTGDYQALVETWNQAGTLSCLSQKVSFKVVAADAPTSAKITTNKGSYYTGENVTFSFTCDGKINDLWVYYPDGSSKAYQNVGSSKTLSFTAPGKYQALVQTWNQAGTAEVMSEKISFTVTSKPTTVKPTTVKPTTQPTTVKPTTQPTTVKPTTVPTTQPTTVKTTKPSSATTAPSTMRPSTSRTTAPTTVSPSTGYDCGVDGHKFVQGWCQVCHAQDPMYIAPPVSADPTTVPTSASTDTTTVNTQLDTSTGPSAPAQSAEQQVVVEENQDDLVLLLCMIAASVILLTMGIMLVLIVKKKKK